MKWQWCEAVHSPQFSAGVKNGGAIHPLPIHLYGIVLLLLKYLGSITCGMYVAVKG
jgi:predicted component of type VI protein secretion system